MVFPLMSYVALRCLTTLLKHLISKKRLRNYLINKDCLNLLLKSINITLYLFCHFFMAVVFFLGSFKD